MNTDSDLTTRLTAAYLQAVGHLVAGNGPLLERLREACRELEPVADYLQIEPADEWERIRLHNLDTLIQDGRRLDTLTEGERVNLALDLWQQLSDLEKSSRYAIGVYHGEKAVRARLRDQPPDN
jgi:hypothetical protein